MRIQQELALDSFTVVYGYGKTIEEGIRALPGSDTDPLDYIFIGGFVFAFIRRALMVRGC